MAFLPIYEQVPNDGGEFMECADMKKSLEEKNDERLMRKRLFIRALAEYISGNAGMKSIELEMGKPHAVEWAKVRTASPILCTTDVKETENQLLEYFGVNR